MARGSVAVASLPEEYKLSDMDSAGDPTYYGYMDASGDWYIMQLNTASGTARYVRGAGGYAAAWTGRAGLTYGYYDATF